MEFVHRIHSAQWISCQNSDWRNIEVSLAGLSDYFDDIVNIAAGLARFIACGRLAALTCFDRRVCDGKSRGLYLNLIAVGVALAHRAIEGGAGEAVPYTITNSQHTVRVPPRRLVP